MNIRIGIGAGDTHQGAEEGEMTALQTLLLGLTGTLSTELVEL